ncbi:MAG: bifunctional methylenetetrahydrofolate dehydrogenase/methenyltetrahydrofolate cyclohydrolase FolD [Clostridiales bacterium]|jgi:methylenetetrahydrofolate dehydrogenase (NADP+)/methenyltetrahydrofolate cyclohydrolase|nr:bifunctional methylenetetrahydrofolate dehydrogenase/methenyltetrahydrofolate cyclohydrolase FolD [Clostridiales bacterium]
MKARIIDGKLVSERLRGEIKAEAARFLAAHGRPPGLAVILAGEDPASEIYVKNKITACESTGIKSVLHRLPACVTEAELVGLIESANRDETVDGLLVQLPLPKGLDEKRILSRVSPDKDVDGFHAVNAGNLLLGNPCLAACTPSGIIELIKETGLPIAGKNAVVVGRSNIVGKPAALLLLQQNATVTICHSRTADLKSVTKTADILVAAVGIKAFITGDMIKPGAVVIDVGMNRFEGKLYGDVCFAEAAETAGFITPVPGGVGPMTITMLLKNTLKAAFARAK